jgi:hypothetical protein
MRGKEGVDGGMELDEGSGREDAQGGMESGK